MAKVLADPIYKDDSIFDLRINDDKTSSLILINDEIEYTIRRFEINVHDENFREYRSYTITRNEDRMYIVNKDGRVIRIVPIIDIEHNIDDLFNGAYDIIDDIINYTKENGK